MFIRGKTYKIEGKLFRYLGKVRDREYYRFVCIDNPEDVRDISIYLGDYLYTILRGTA